MENYEKGSVVELPDESGLTFHPNVIHMKVNQGSKIRNVMGYAMKKIKEPEVRQITWNGYGPAITKTISCAEILKRKIKGLHQITKIRFKRTEEIWEPKQDGLERLKVNQDVPSITILLSLEPLDESEPGYQAPGNLDPFWKKSIMQENEKAKSNPQKDKSKRLDKSNTGGNSSLNPPPMDRKKRKRKEGRGFGTRKQTVEKKEENVEDMET